LLGVAAFVIGAVVGQIYTNAQLSIRGDMSNVRSTVLSHFGAGVAGIVVYVLFTDGESRLIGLCRPHSNTYSAQDSFGRETFRRIDRVARPPRVFHSLNKWISIRVDVVGTTFSSSAIYLVRGTGPIHEPGSAANTDFSSNVTVGFSTTILWWIRRLK